MFRTKEIGELYSSQTSAGVESLAPANLVHLPAHERVGMVQDIRGGGDSALYRRLDCTGCRHTAVCGGECRRIL